MPNGTQYLRTLATSLFLFCGALLVGWDWTFNGIGWMLQEQQRLYGALFALRILTRKYEFKDEEERAPLGTLVDATFPILLQIFQARSPAPAPCTLAVRMCMPFVHWQAGN